MKTKKQDVSHPTDFISLNFCALPKEASAKREDAEERFYNTTVISAFHNTYAAARAVNSCTVAMLQAAILFV